MVSRVSLSWSCVIALSPWSSGVAHAQVPPDEPVWADAQVIQVEDTAPPSQTLPGSDRVEVRDDHRTLSDVLDDAPGVRVIHTGGQGSAWQVGIRGLQGRRVATYLGPVRLDDPVTGTLDLSEVPAAALGEASLTRGATSSSEGALGGALHLKPAPPVMPVLRGSVGIASENAATFDVAAGAPANHGKAMWGVMALARGSSTSGEFAYEPIAGPRDAPVVLPARQRANNDRRRLGFTLVGAGEWLDGPSGSAVVDVAVMQGGLPGFGLVPITSTRLAQSRLATGAQLSWPVRPWLLPSLECSARVNAWRFVDERPAGQRGALWSATFTTTAGLGLRIAPGLWAHGAVMTEMDAARTTEAAGAFDAARPRVDANLGVRAEPWDGRVRVEARMHAVTWMGLSRPTEEKLRETQWHRPRAQWLPEIRAEVEPVESLVLHGSIARAWRVPSMEEMYRPDASMLAGNPDLKPEDGVEANGGARASIGPLSGIVAIYAARMDNMIAYINVNAFDLRPENVSHVWRTGGELSARLGLGDWGSVGAGADVNYSYVEATRAPLPSVPLIELRSHAMLGPPRVRGIVEVRARSGATGNLSGELPVRPGSRVDLGVALTPLPTRAVEVRAMVLNLTDDKTQTDVWGVPQPGREAMVTVALDPGAAMGGLQ